MRTPRSYLYLALLCCASTVVAAPSELTFDHVASEISGVLTCQFSATSRPTYEGEGRLYGCVAGDQQTAKVFVNEQGSTGTIKDITVMWNDWTEGTIHADKKDALVMLGMVVGKYVPEKKKEIINLFAKKKGKKLETENFHIEYTFTKGPAIDERLITLTPKR